MLIYFVICCAVAIGLLIVGSAFIGVGNGFSRARVSPAILTGWAFIFVAVCIFSAGCYYFFPWTIHFKSWW